MLEKRGRVADVVYLLKLALKAARDCIGMGLGVWGLRDLILMRIIEEKESNLATTVLQKAADYKSSLQDLGPKMATDEIAEYNCLEVEYFILRTGLVSSVAFGYGGTGKSSN